MDRMLSVKDIMENLHMSEKNAYKLVKHKGFPKITINGRYFIPEEHYKKWVNENVKHEILI